MIEKVKEGAIEDYVIEKEPFYLSVNNEVELFTVAYEDKIPVLLKGPTGCGKTRFLEHMAYKLGRPLVTVACHEDLVAGDLVGRYLLQGDRTVWADGPLTIAVKNGAICYLDEIVEARKDTTVLIHPLTDNRRILPIEKKGHILEAPDSFMLVISYNPGYQSVIKDLKQSTKQRFIALDFNYPPPDLEIKIITRESGVGESLAKSLVKIGEKVRNLKEHGLEEGVSTRLLIYAGQLTRKGIDPKTACEVAIVKPITYDREMQISISEIVSAVF